MSGGWPSQAGKRVVRAGDERSEGDYTARRFPPEGLALTAWGPQAPLFQTNKGSRRLSFHFARPEAL